MNVMLPEGNIIKYLVLQRFDQLQEVEQVILKVASVVGIAPLPLIVHLVPLRARGNTLYVIIFLCSNILNYQYKIVLIHYINIYYHYVKFL